MSNERIAQVWEDNDFVFDSVMFLNAGKIFDDIHGEYNIKLFIQLIDNGSTAYIHLSGSQLIKLLENDLQIDKIKLHHLYTVLKNKIQLHKSTTKSFLDRFLPPDLVNIVNDYQIF